MIGDKVVLHLDLDGFYAQVEQVRLGLDDSVPVCVQQWNGIIACNYAAKNLGIGRFLTADKVKQQFPQARLVHVETVDEHGTGSQVRPSQQKACLERYRKASASIFAVFAAYGLPLERASIDEAYVDVSELVALCEKAGGLSNSASACQRVEESLWDRYANNPNVFVLPLPNDNEEIIGGQSSSDSGAQTSLEGDDPPVQSTHRLEDMISNIHSPKYSSTFVKGVGWALPAQLGADDSACVDWISSTGEGKARYAIGAAIAAHIRRSVLVHTKYNCSAGIASTKLLAKLGSAMHKPKGQTIIPDNAAESMLKSMPLESIRYMGGKLGRQIKELSSEIKTAGDVVCLPRHVLERAFGPRTTAWILDLCIGKLDEEVVERGRPKSMLAAKSFPLVRELSACERWMNVLAFELCKRMKDEFDAHRRRAKTLTLHYRPTSTHPSVGNRAGLTEKTKARIQGMAEAYGRRASGASKSIRVPSNHKLFEPAAVVAEGMAVLKSLPDVLPCAHLSLSAHNFIEDPLTAGIDSLFEKVAQQRSEDDSNEDVNTELGAVTKKGPKNGQPGLLELFKGEQPLSDTPSAIAEDSEMRDNSNKGDPAILFPQDQSVRNAGNDNEDKRSNSDIESTNGESRQNTSTSSASSKEIVGPAAGQSAIPSHSGELSPVPSAQSDKQCDRCGQAIPASSWQSHVDWHMALSLQQCYDEEHSISESLRRADQHNQGVKRGKGKAPSSGKQAKVQKRSAGQSILSMLGAKGQQ